MQILDDRQVELAHQTQHLIAPRVTHGVAKRVLHHRLQINRAERATSMRLGERIGPDALAVHGDRHQRDAKPGRDALDHRIGQRLHGEAPADRHQRRDGRRDRLPAAACKQKILRPRPPAIAREEVGADPSGLGQAALGDGRHGRAERLRLLPGGQ